MSEFVRSTERIVFDWTSNVEYHFWMNESRVYWMKDDDDDYGDDDDDDDGDSNWFYISPTV